jgi:acyl dehydratase
VSAPTFDIGDAITPLEVTITPEQVRRYATVAQMPGQRFFSDDVARKEGLPGQILPGNMSLALLTRAFLDWLPDARIDKIGATFRGIVRPNEPIRVTGFVTDTREESDRLVLECDLVLETQGERRVTAVAVASLPAG